MTARPGSDQGHGRPVPAGHQRVLLPFHRLLVAVHQTANSMDNRLVRPLRERVRGGAGRGAKGHGRPEVTWLLWWLVAGLLALAFLPINVALAATEFDVPPLVAFVASIGQSTALTLILVRPTTATALQFLAVAVFAVAIPPDSGSTWPLTVPGMFTLIAHVGLVAARTTRRTGLVTWGASGLLLTLVVVLDPRGRSVTDGLTIMILYPSLSAIVLGAVLMTGRWKEIRRELASARRDVEVEQSQRAIAEERNRIARELHDVVAHSMSVIHMQATSASYRITDLDPEAKADFERIAADARSVMREMRHVLAVLRGESADTALTPVPDLGRIAELVESAKRAGVPVELREAEAVRAAVLPERVALAAYRVIQESLSNVIRHAPGARTTISLDLEASDLVLSVVNDAGAQPAEPMEEPKRTGHGLSGMHERVRLVGGSLETGAREGGGYRVAARLPVGGDE